jgi:hypothetical protein
MREGQQRLSIPIRGDYESNQDSSIEVESYDEDITLVIVTIGDDVYPIEFSNSNALLIADAIEDAATGE